MHYTRARVRRRMARGLARRSRLRERGVWRLERAEAPTTRDVSIATHMRHSYARTAWDCHMDVAVQTRARARRLRSATLSSPFIS
jgi:Ribonuclease G/E